MLGENIMGTQHHILNNENKKKKINIECNGEHITFINEVKRKISSYQKKNNSLSLQHDIMVISHNQEESEITSVIQSDLEATEIKWNQLVFGEKNSNSQGPEVFKCIKPMGLITTAKRAGILKVNLALEFIGFGLTALISFILALMINYSINGGINNINGSIFWVSIVSTINLFVWNILKNKLVEKNKKLYQLIIQHVEKSVNKNEGKDTFSEYLAERIISEEMPLVIIVKDVDALDWYTKKIIQRILTTDSQQSVGVILWLILSKDRSCPQHEWIDSIKKNSNSLNNVSFKMYRLEELV